MSEPERAGAPLDVLSRVQHWIATLALVVMMVVVVADVVLRFAFSTPIRGAYDVVSIGLLVMVFFGIAPVIVRQGEILIDLIDIVASPSLLRALRVAAALGTIGVFAFVAWSMAGPARDAWLYGDRSLELGIAVWTLWAVAFLGLVGILLAAARRIVAELRGDHTAVPPNRDEGAL